MTLFAEVVFFLRLRFSSVIFNFQLSPKRGIIRGRKISYLIFNPRKVL